MVNIVGDKAVGKTLLAIEAAANFAARWPSGHIWYRESEAAFDEEYAAELGIPVKRIDFGPDGLDTIWDTVEDIYEDLEPCLEISGRSGEPGLYIIDSLDALSSRAEQQRKIDEGSYRTEKPRALGELFRRRIREIKRSQICFMIVSQVRERIGVTFGEKYTRTGGKSLDFYASQILWLHNLGTKSSTIQGVKQIHSVEVRAKCKKNKIGIPFRECDFRIRFGYGMDDISASIDWLAERGLLTQAGLRSEKEAKTYLREASQMSTEARLREAHRLGDIVAASWSEITDRFRPPNRKYV
jgi:recombination protein RecA